MEGARYPPAPHLGITEERNVAYALTYRPVSTIVLVDVKFLNLSSKSLMAFSTSHNPRLR